MKQEIYLHSISPKTSVYYNSKKTLPIFEEILKSGYLLSSRKRGINSSNNFSGRDYISLCDYEKINEGKGIDKKYNGFYEFNVKTLNLVFPKGQFEVVKPIVLEKPINEYPHSKEYMKILGEDSENRYTDLEDEVQVKDSISLECLSSIALPSKDILNYWLSREKNIDILKREVEKYRKLLMLYGYDIPIYDIETFTSLDETNELTFLVNQLKLRK